MLVDLMDGTMVDYWVDTKDVHLVDCLVDLLDETMVA